jgi:hypothetical protein
LAVASEFDDSSGTPADGAFLAKCTTCSVSKRFYTELGVSGFRLEHYEHDVVVDRPSEAAQARAKEPAPEAAMSRRPGEPSAINLEKLLVRVLPSDTDESVYFEVKGLTAAGGFSMDFPLAKAREVRDFIGKDSCVINKNGETQEFKWTKTVVHADSEASSLLGLRIGEIRGGSELSTQPERIKQSKKEAPRVAPAAPEPSDATKQEVVSRVATKEKRETLLVGNSFYLQEGEDVEKEALRISRALKELRWGVEPPYLISIMIDDNVGIEANGSVITADLVGKIEPLGYRLVAMNAPNGKPTAWFKRKEMRLPNDARPEETESHDTSDAVRHVETLVKLLEEERSKLAQEMAAHEARAASLLDQMGEIESALRRKRKEAQKD